VVPNRMMNDLEMPLSLTRFQINANKTLAEEIVARSMSTVEIGGWRFDRQIYESQLFIDADLSPHASVPVCRPRVVQPGLVPKFARSRNRVEGPEQPAGSNIKRSNQTLGVVVGLHRHAFFVCGSDNDHVLNDGGSGMQT